MQINFGGLFKVFTLIFLGVGLNTTASAGLGDYKSVFDCENKDRFNWYCKEIAKKKENKAEPPTPLDAKTDPRDPIANAPELKEHEAIKERLENLMKIAYVNPTEENVRNYIAFQNMVSNKASVLSDVWERVLWSNPELDYSLKQPTSAKAITTKEYIDHDKREAVFKSLNEQGFGLFFFYKSNCQYCHAMSMPLKMFLTQTNMDMIPISVDGVLRQDLFPGSIKNNGQAEELGITRTPTLMLVNTQTKNIYPISYGAISMQEMKDRIYKITATKPGEEL